MVAVLRLEERDKEIDHRLDVLTIGDLCGRVEVPGRDRDRAHGSGPGRDLEAGRVGPAAGQDLELVPDVVGLRDGLQPLVDLRVRDDTRVFELDGSAIAEAGDVLAVLRARQVVRDSYVECDGEALPDRGYTH